jgi:chromosome segregation ATPase
MKCFGIFAMAAATLARAENPSSNPLSKAIELMGELAAKVTQDGVEEEKAYVKYSDWCEETAKNQQFTIESATTKKDKLEATIEKASADIEAATGKIEDLAGKIATAEQELKDATEIRKKEEADFLKEEATLVEAIDELTRAIGIIEKEMAKNPAAFVQADTSSIEGIVNALSAVTDAAGLDVATTQKLSAFLQEKASEEDGDDGAPDPAAYKSHSKGILDVLDDLKTKAEDELAALRKAESNTKQNYKLLKESLEDEIAYNTKEKTEEEDFKSEQEEAKATATGDLAKTVNLLEETKKSLEETQTDCMKVARDHDYTVAGIAAELKVIAEAKKILMETTSGASEQTYSFMQVAAASRMKTATDLKSAEVVRFIKKLARDQHSKSIMQLASRVAALMQYGARNGEDPFTKVIGLIKDMIAKLEAEAAAAAKEKAYCDEQMSKTEAKKSELEDDVAKMTAKIDEKTAQSAELKAEVKELQEELASLAKEQAELDKVREENKAAFEQAKADLELGLKGLSQALSKLRKYYQGGDALLQQPAKPMVYKKADGAGGSIIDILEVCESDFAKELSDRETEEADQVDAYEKRTQEIKVATATASKSVEYKVQEFKTLDKEVDELNNDRAATDEELQAVLEYYSKVKERCIAKPESYEERKARREAEIAGLKEALSILNNDAAALIQTKTRKRRSMRGVLAAQ